MKITPSFAQSPHMIYRTDRGANNAPRRYNRDLDTKRKPHGKSIHSGDHSSRTTFRLRYF
jgi:hypothetical protein